MFQSAPHAHVPTALLLGLLASSVGISTAAAADGAGLPPVTPPAPMIVVEPPVAPAAPAALDPVEPAKAQTGVVHIESDQGVSLEAYDAERSRWVPLCDSPCDRALPTGGMYRVTGEDIRTSPNLELHATLRGPIVLRVSTASKSLHSAGIAVAGTGVVGLVGGGVFVFAGFYTAIAGLGANDGNGNSSTTNTGGTMIEGGAIAAGAGLVALIVGGAILLATPNPSTVQQTNFDPFFRPTAEVHGATWLRAPAWQAASVAETPLPKVVTVPLFSTRF